MKLSFRVHPGGQIDCLYTEAIDLPALGRLEVVRATDIRFDHSKQVWDVHEANTGKVIFSHPSRGECLRWERETLQPKTTPPLIQPNHHLTNP